MADVGNSYLPNPVKGSPPTSDCLQSARSGLILSSAGLQQHRRKHQSRPAQANQLTLTLGEGPASTGKIPRHRHFPAQQVPHTGRRIAASRRQRPAPTALATFPFRAAHCEESASAVPHIAKRRAHLRSSREPSLLACLLPPPRSRLSPTCSRSPCRLSRQMKQLLAQLRSPARNTVSHLPGQKARAPIHTTSASTVFTTARETALAVAGSPCR